MWPDVGDSDLATFASHPNALLYLRASDRPGPAEAGPEMLRPNARSVPGSDDR
ncbi:hypothetical protein HSR122_0112 [Halapricum desulfuricans]|uniref:Uncharacterized protein n=1 Tax=Halapricum desulfuricans TaxID=2841257 RepID=A0A897N4H8_9EURY|nr:hypothetical protein HSR122_0112 [Halapricum desulfuricans]